MQENLNWYDLYHAALRAGAVVVEEPSWSPARRKAHGRMWEGRAKLLLNDHLLGFTLWYHGGDTITEEEARGKMSLSSVDGKDAYWRCRGGEEHLWLHETGWFHDDRLRELPLEEVSETTGFTRLW